MADKEKKRNAVKSRLESIIRLGGACFNCGESDVVVLDIHHKNGGGTKHRAFYGRDYDLYYLSISLLPYNELHQDYQTLCANCHRRSHSNEVTPAVDDTELVFDRWQFDHCANHPEMGRAELISHYYRYYT